jgi:toxin ParE1/3/4
MKVLITDEAWADMLGIARNIMQDNPARAGSFVDELYERCQTLADAPRAYPLLPNYESEGIRRRVHGNYLIFFRVKDDSVDVLHVLHGARDYGRLLFGDE